MRTFPHQHAGTLRRRFFTPCVFALLFSAGAANAQTDGLTFEIAPTPDWVERVEPPAGPPAVLAPIHYRLINEQNAITDGGVTHYSHTIKRVNAQTGLAQAAQMELGFNPAFQTLVLHVLAVRRGDTTIDLLDRRYVRLLQRETDLERQMYNGFVTASIVLPDVRVGDEVELAYSIIGQNPVFEGRYFQAAWMQARKGPTQLYRVRFKYPRGRPLRTNLDRDDPSVAWRDTARAHDLVLTRKNVPQVRLEPSAAWSVIEDQLVELSEFDDWNAVATWGAAVFDAAGTGDSAATQEVAARIRRSHSTHAARVLAAVDFVQKEIRYFGTEIGPYSHRPVSPRQVLEQRFGDCKDKVVLLRSILKQFGVRSTPVLVSTRLAGRAKEALPSPRVFDHAILAVHTKDKTIYVDPTRRHQSGTLEAREVFGFDAGLHLAASTTGFDTLPTGAEQLAWELTDTYVISAFDKPAQLTSVIRYHGIHAEGVSENIATAGQSQVLSQLNTGFNRLYQQLETIAEPTVTRDTDIDAVAVTQQFRVGDFWINEDYSAIVAPLHKWSILDQLRVPSFEARDQAMALAPGRIKHTVIVEYPPVESIEVDTIESSLDSPQARYDGKLASERGRIVSSGEVTISGREVTPEQWQKHAEFVRELAGRSTASLSIPTLREADLPRIRKEYEAIERKAKRKAVTDRQRDSWPSRYLLTERLKADRLSPELRAEVLWDRGVDNDHLGDYDAAQRDFTAARQLDPDNAQYNASWAGNAVSRGAFADAIAVAEQLLADDPDDTYYQYLKARALYFDGRIEAAAPLFRSIVDDGDNDRVAYSIVFLRLIALQQGDREFDIEIPDSVDDGWTRSLAEHSIGKITDRDLINRAKRSDKRPQQLCEAYFYIGEAHRITGDLKSAKKHMQRTVKQGVTEYVEHGYALNALKNM